MQYFVAKVLSYYGVLVYFIFYVIIKISEYFRILMIFVLLFKTKSSLPKGLFIAIMKGGV